MAPQLISTIASAFWLGVAVLTALEAFAHDGLILWLAAIASLGYAVCCAIQSIGDMPVPTLGPIGRTASFLLGALLLTGVLFFASHYRSPSIQAKVIQVVDR